MDSGTREGTHQRLFFPPHFTLPSLRTALASPSRKTGITLICYSLNYGGIDKGLMYVQYVPVNHDKVCSCTTFRHGLHLPGPTRENPVLQPLAAQ